MEFNKLINRYCSYLLPSPPPRETMQRSATIDLDSVSQQVDGNLHKKNYKFFKTKNQPPTEKDLEVVSSYRHVVGTLKKGVVSVSNFLTGTRKAPLSTQNQFRSASVQSGQPLHPRQQFNRATRANNGMNVGLIKRCGKCNCANKLQESCPYCFGKQDIEIISDSESGDKSSEPSSMTSAQMSTSRSNGISPHSFYPTKENNSSRNASRLNASASSLNTSALNGEPNRKYEVDYLFVGTHRFLSRTFIRITDECLILNIASYKESINIDFKLIKCMHYYQGKIDNSTKHTYIKIDFLEQAVDAINDYIERRADSNEATRDGSFRFQSINGHEKYFVMKLKFMQPIEAQELREKLRIYLPSRFKEDSSVLQFFEEQREYCLQHRSTRNKRQKTSDSKIRNQDQLRVVTREIRNEAMEVDSNAREYPTRAHRTPTSYNSGYNTRSMAIYERPSSLSNRPSFGSIKLVDDDMEVSEVSQVTESDLSFENIKNSKIVFETVTGETLVILKSDLQCLSDGNFLNDKIIEFYLIYIKSKLIEPAITEKTYIFSSFFFTKMLSLSRGSQTEEWASFFFFSIFLQCHLD